MLANNSFNCSTNLLALKMANSKLNFITAEEKKQLLDRYSDFEWANDVTSFQCVNCHRVAIQHYISDCQHVYCNECIEMYNSEEHKNCSQCQQTVTQMNNQNCDDKNWELETKIHQLITNCPNKKFGCNIVDSLRKIPEHLKQCEYGGASNCPTINSGSNIAEDITRNVANMRVSNDKFREEIRKTIATLENRVERLETNLSNLELKVDTKVNEVSTYLMGPKTNIRVPVSEGASGHTSANKIIVDWKIINLDKTFGTKPLEIESEVYSISEDRLSIRAKLVKNGDWVKISLKCINQQNNMQEIDRKAFSKFTYILRDQRNTEQKQDLVITKFLLFNEPLEYGQWFMKKTFVKAKNLYSLPFFRNNSISLQIIIEPISNPYNTISDNGTLIWRIDNFMKRKYMEDNGLIFYHQGPFTYTSPNEYKCQIGVYLNFEGAMQVKVLFVASDNDTFLSNYFPHMTTITLIHQGDPSKSVTRRVIKEKPQLYEIGIVSCADLMKSGFVQSNAIIIEAKIQAIQKTF